MVPLRDLQQLPVSPGKIKQHFGFLVTCEFYESKSNLITSGLAVFSHVKRAARFNCVIRSESKLASKNILFCTYLCKTGHFWQPSSALLAVNLNDREHLNASFPAQSN